MSRQGVNSSTGELIKQFADHGDGEIQSALAAAHALYKSDWSKGPIQPRLDVLARLADLIEEREEELAEILVREMGKRISEARFEVQVTADIARHDARSAATFLAPQRIETSHGDAWLEYHPIGVVVAVEPWSSPYYQLVRIAGPNIAAGNPVLAKHAGIVPQAATAFEKLVTAAGAPLGAWTNVVASGERIGSLIADGRVQGVALTGPEKAGGIVATQAARTHRKSVLELGGAGVFVVLGDANLEKAVKIGAIARPKVRPLDTHSGIGADHASFSRRPGTLDGRRLQRVLDYIDANLGKEITVEDLASAAALSRFHFSRMFKATTGRTPGRFIGQRRLELTKALLAEGRSITQIAQACGFASESNFGRSFHKATGVTPGRYRRLAQDQRTPSASHAGVRMNAAQREYNAALEEHALDNQRTYVLPASRGETSDALVPLGRGERAEGPHGPQVACSAGKYPEEMTAIMPRSYTTLTLEDARRMLQAGEARATSIGLPYNIAVVDAGGHLIAFSRQDGALIGSIDLAIGKAMTARLFDKTTAYLAELAQPGAPLFGIEQSNGSKVVIFGGGLPVRIGGNIVGAVGASAGTVEQDIAVAEAASAAVRKS